MDLPSAHRRHRQLWPVSPAQQTMLNFRVRDLGAMLAQLRAKGAQVAKETQDMQVSVDLAGSPILRAIGSNGGSPPDRFEPTQRVTHTDDRCDHPRRHRGADLIGRAWLRAASSLCLVADPDGQEFIERRVMIPRRDDGLAPGTSRPTTLNLGTGFGDRFASSQGCSGSLREAIETERRLA